MKKRRNGKPGKEKGFTIIELMVSILLLAMVFLSLFMIVTMANQVLRSNNISSNLNQSAMQELRSVLREIGQTSPNATPSHLNITTDVNNNSVVRFQIPVDWDNDGDADTGGLNPQAEWGAYDRVGFHTNGRLGAWARYSVVNGQLVRDVLDNALAIIQPQSQIIANDVLSFLAAQSQNTLTLTLTLRATDQTGKKATQVRSFQQVFTATTILRNAVN